MDALESFVSALPKVELHVHLVGSAPIDTVLTLARRHPERGVPTSEEQLREFYSFRDFPHFIDVYMAVSGLLSEPEDIAALIAGIARQLGAAGTAPGGPEINEDDFAGEGVERNLAAVQGGNGKRRSHARAGQAGIVQEAVGALAILTIFGSYFEEL